MGRRLRDPALHHSRDPVLAGPCTSGLHLAAPKGGGEGWDREPLAEPSGVLTRAGGFFFFFFFWWGGAFLPAHHDDRRAFGHPDGQRIRLVDEVLIPGQPSAHIRR